MTADLAGMVTHRDLLAASSSSLSVPAEADRVRLLGLARAVDVMETHVSVATPGDPAAVAGERMIRHKIGCLPVVGADGRLAGIVTEEDFVRWATAHMTPADAARQSAYPSRRSAGGSPERQSAQHPARTAEAVLESRDLGSDAPPAVPQVVPGARERAARGRHGPRAVHVRRRRDDRRPP